MTSLNSLLTTRRRRRGTTSPLLINIHHNPGPRHAASRRKRSSEHKTIPYHRLSDAQSQEIEVRLRAGETVEAIARAVGCKIETINLRRARLRQLGEIKLYPAGRPPKSRRRKREDDASDERHPDSQPNPKQRRKLSEREKGALDYAFRGEDTESHIAATVGCHPRTVRKWIARVHRPGGLDRKPGSGRPRKTNERTERHILREEKKQSQISASDIHRSMRAILDLPVSVWTVRRRFRAAGLPARRPAKKPFLTKRHKKARLEWARLHESWTPEDWRHVVWCDETGFRLWSDRGPRYVRRKVGERYRADKVVRTVKKGDGKILAWGCFSSVGVGPIHRISGNMTGTSYHSILVRKAMHYIWQLFADHPDIPQWTFAQDNDPKHGSNLNKKYLNKKVAHPKSRLEIMKWPSQSPDINPLEHIWNWLKADLDKLGSRPTSPDALWEWLQAAWGRVPMSLITSVVDGMPRRVAAVIEARGDATKY